MSIRNKKIAKAATKTPSKFGSDWGWKLSALLGIRTRYLTTRNDRLRLRYTTVPALAALLALPMMSIQTDTLHGGLQQIATLSAPQNVQTDESALPLYDRYATVQKRMSRYGVPDLQPEPAGVSGRFMSVSMLSLPPVPKPEIKKISFGKGDTLASVLDDAGVADDEAVAVIEALKDHFDPRQIRPGQKIEVKFNPVKESGERNVTSLNIAVDPLKTVSLQRDDNGSFESSIQEIPVEKQTEVRHAEIETSLYGSAVRAGIPSSIVAQAIRLFSFDIDFQRDIQRGDTLDVMYENYETDDGKSIRTGDVLYAKMDVDGKDVAIYRYKDSSGNVNYYTADGKTTRKSLMRTPVDGARMSSGFGLRRHPILGYTKMHKGMDFAAPTGTPIYAAGDGTIEYAGRNGSYGNYVRIRHSTTMKTAYAHMKKFAAGIRQGSRVKQGQVIGYVGTTGRSTGAHLHYEILMNGSQVNPANIKTAQADVLKGRALDKFKDFVHNMNDKYAEALKEQESLVASGRFDGDSARFR